LNPDHHSPADAAGLFRTTRWRVVLLSAQSKAPGSQAAVVELCRLYRYPLYAFVRYRGHAPHDAQRKFCTNADRAGSKKRGRDREFESIDAQRAKERYRLEPVDYLTAETIFDARWAMAVLEEAMNRLRQNAAGKKASMLEKLEPFLDLTNKIELPSYEKVAAELQISHRAVKTLIHRLRKQYTALLREEVGRTVSDSVEIDDEIHALCGAIVGSEGRIDP
jgi:biotin operon repressor